MSRVYLVDGHNALHRLVAQPPREADAARGLVIRRTRDALADEARGATAHVVFDTTPAGRIRAGTHGRDGDVTWSYADGSADEEILRLVRDRGARHGAARLCVVTDDRELSGRARQLGAGTVGVRTWFPDDAPAAGAVAPSAPAPGRVLPPMTPADFGFTSDVIDLDGPVPGDDDRG